ncbi:hypothetical protein [Nostoc sp. C052]|uniref:hypothetical protein n=1 Tax=Nostoc sp. C052 TaxID=2576902 RepID=UPI0015C3AD89|nr:hypothetical protein [Nostoc sp. C052]
MATGLGTLAIFTAVTTYREWQVRRQGWCVRFSSDGKQKVLYGDDCRSPVQGETLKRK